MAKRYDSPIAQPTVLVPAVSPMTTFNPATVMKAGPTGTQGANDAPIGADYQPNLPTSPVLQPETLKSLLQRQSACLSELDLIGKKIAALTAKEV